MVILLVIYNGGPGNSNGGGNNGNKISTKSDTASTIKIFGLSGIVALTTTLYWFPAFSSALDISK